MITVFYDGKCGLCRSEIEHYIKIAPINTFAWVDITITPHLFLDRGYKIGDGLKALHVEDAEKNMHKGVDAFVIIWRHLPRFWCFLPYIFKIPFALPISKKLYSLFAEWRFKKLGYNKCDI